MSRCLLMFEKYVFPSQRAINLSPYDEQIMCLNCALSLWLSWITLTGCDPGNKNWNWKYVKACFPPSAFNAGRYGTCPWVAHLWPNNNELGVGSTTSENNTIFSVLVQACCP